MHWQFVWLRFWACSITISLLVMCGCIGRALPVQIETENKVKLDGPLEGKFTASLAATNAVEPLIEQRIESPGWQGNATTTSGPKMGVIDVDGILLNGNNVGLYSTGENPVALFREKLDRFERDHQVLAVVIRLNCPGGSVAATEIMTHDLEQFRKRSGKPVVVTIQDLGCGGGYFLATQADYIVAQPGSMVGGIGVILNLYNLQDMMAQFNILNQSIKAGPMVDMATTNKALTEDARQLLQTMADQYHRRFQQQVVTHRRLTSEGQLGLDGRVVSADQALQFGWIDEIGFMEDALLKARGLSRAPQASAIMLRRPGDPARTPYAVTPNQPIALVPLSFPGMDRSKWPTFMYVWAPDPTLDRLGSK